MTTLPFTDGWEYRGPTGPFAAAFGAAATPTPVRLPHDALRDEARSPDAPSGGASAYFPRGAYTYLKKFEVPADWMGRTVHLEIEGAYRRAQVFLNDELVANRADGYARFFVDLTPFLAFGSTNRLRIEVRAGEDSRWYSGAGLHRPVSLHVAPSVHFVPDGIHVRTTRVEADQAVLLVTAEVRNRDTVTCTTRVRTEIFDASGTRVEYTSTPLTLTPGEQGKARQVFYIRSPHLWSPDSPSLYRASVSIDDDVADIPFGVRTVTVDPRQGLRINGEPTLLRGACVHHDNGPSGAAAIARAEERRVELLKAAGFNAIRAAHKPLSVAMLDACDRLGMLVIDENRNFGSSPEHLEQLRAMVRRDRNHPSVLMYSLGNEIAEVVTPHGARWTRRLAERVRELDDTRLVTISVNTALSVIDELSEMIEAMGGLNAAQSDVETFAAVDVSDAVTARTEESAAAVDVFGLNYAESRYPLDAALFPNRVIVGSETYPPEIGRLWPLVTASPNVLGDFTWTGWDYLGEVGIGSLQYADDERASGAFEREYPYLSAWTGDIDITGWRRPISYYREIVYGLRIDPYIAVRRPQYRDRTIAKSTRWGWSDSLSTWTWPGFEHRPIVVEVYAAADEVVLTLDGIEIGRGTTGVERPRLAVIEATYQPGTLVAIALRAGVEVGRTVLTTAGGPKLTAAADRSALRAGDDDLAFIAIEWRDEVGELVTSVQRDVTVRVSGAGALAGMCSGNPATTERFDSPTWRTFDGRAIAIVRPVGAGPVSVVVTSGAETVHLHLFVS